MKLIGKSGLSRVVEVGLIALLVVVPALLLTLPWSITWITARPADVPFYVKYLVILAYSGVMSELILWQARGIIHNVNCGHVFTADTVRRLRVTAVEVLVLAVFYGATMFWMSKFFKSDRSHVVL